MLWIIAQTAATAVVACFTDREQVGEKRDPEEHGELHDAAATAEEHGELHDVAATAPAEEHGEPHDAAATDSGYDLSYKLPANPTSADHGVGKHAFDASLNSYEIQRKRQALYDWL